MSGAFDSSFDSSFDIGEEEGTRATLLGTGDDEPLDSRKGPPIGRLSGVLDSVSARWYTQHTPPSATISAN